MREIKIIPFHTRILILVVFLIMLFFHIDLVMAQSPLELTRDEKNYIEKLGPVKISVDPDWYPYETIREDGNYYGIAAELIGLISKRTGVKFELVQTKSWSESIEYSMAGTTDVLAFLNETEGRKSWLIFTDTYYTDPNVIITREEHDYITDLSRLSDETIALPKGTSIEERIRKDFPNIKLIIVDSEDEAIHLVSKRKVDMTVRSLTMAAYVIKNEGLFNLKIAGEIPKYNNEFKIGVRKELPELQKILNKGIATITQEEVQMAVNKYIAIKVEKGFDYKGFFILTGFFSILLMLGILWNRKLKRLSNRLSISEKLYKSILTASPDAIVISNHFNEIIMASPKTKDIIKCKDDETLIGRRLEEFITDEDQESFKSNLQKLIRGEKISTTEYTGVRCDGKTFKMEVNSDVIQKVDEDFHQLVSILRDVTEKRKFEVMLLKSEENYRLLSEELEIKNRILNETAIHDKLTGIPNRYYFDQKVIEEMEIGVRYGTPLLLLIFDLDKFKVVNDTFGHNTGDQVLIRIAETVKRYMGKRDLFARWGGEEFVVLMAQTKLHGANIVAEKIRMAVAEIVHPRVGTVTISIGISELDPKEDFDAWFKRTDRALYRSKREGRNRTSISEVNEKLLHMDLKWQTSWGCGNEIIDGQHKILLDLCNALIESSLNRVDEDNLLIKLGELIMHLAKHFSDEEKILYEVGYDEVENHSKKHKTLLNEAIALKEKVEKKKLRLNDALKFILRDIIMEHLLNDDMKFFPRFKTE